LLIIGFTDYKNFEKIIMVYTLKKISGKYFSKYRHEVYINILWNDLFWRYKSSICRFW